jgi:hypothetical protein
MRAINSLIFRILRQAASLNLEKFSFNPGRNTARCSDILRIVEKYVVDLDIQDVRARDWVDRVQYHERLQNIQIHNYEDAPDPEADRKFWTGISQLQNCETLLISVIPLSFTWNLQFSYVKSLTLFFSYFDSESTWSASAKAVFTQMPNLEHLHISPPPPLARDSMKSIQLSDLACKNLIDFSTSHAVPRGFFAMLGSRCLDLCEISLELMPDFNDDDLRSLCQCRRLQIIRLHNETSLTTGLAHLTSLPDLTTLELHYSHGKYLTSQLLFDLARSCIRLGLFKLSDWSTRRPSGDSRGFEDSSMMELIAAVHELLDDGHEISRYFEAKNKEYKPEESDGYFVRLDRLREVLSL